MVNRILKFNFITIIVIATLLVLMAICVDAAVKKADAELAQMEQEMDNMRGDGEVEDVDGFALSMYGIAWGLGWLASGVATIFFVWLPMILAVFIGGPAIIAKLIYKGDGKNLLGYRVFMFFSYLWTLVLEIILGAVLVEGIGNPMSLMLIVTVVLFIYVLVVLVLGVRNTYSARIKVSDGGVYEEV